MIIDAHQHFWCYDPQRDGWITDEMKVLKRDFLPNDMHPLLIDNHVDGCIAIQADQSGVETKFLIELASQYSFIKAVVGWADLCSSDLLEILESYMTSQSFCGVRHILQAEPTGFMTSSKFVNGLKVLYEKNLSYDILTTETQLYEVQELVEVLPEIRLVIDHISKPNIKDRSFDHWAGKMKEIGRHENVYVKLSGLATEANWESWTPKDFEPYIDICLENFGPDRLMFGSDWPVCNLAGDYYRIISALQENISKLSVLEQNKIMGLTAQQFYQID